MRSPIAITIAGLLLGALAMVGCGDSNGGNGGGDSAATIAKCEALCAVQGQASSCPDSVATTYVGQCKQLCSVIIPALTADCKTTAGVYFDCAAGDPWACGMGGDLPLDSDGANCQTELDA